jgi:hypothetical protein
MIGFRSERSGKVQSGPTGFLEGIKKKMNRTIRPVAIGNRK